VRLFFSLLPPSTAASRLAEFIAHCELPRGSRPIDRVNLHLTLAFVGEAEAGEVHAIGRLSSVVDPGKVSVRLDRCVYWRNSRVIVATTQGRTRGLHEMSSSLQAAVSLYRSAARDELKWRPHVTLARNVSQPPVLQAMSPIEWTASSFSLMSSERRDGRSVYTVVDTYPLLDKI
jgi:RNA 2',3'-cyclic 3'-phosphodiesterase